jgi:hypothetical protein
LRYDLFQTKKSVHIKLTKESHTALREKLFRYNVTMQDLFQEVTDLVLAEGDRSEKLLQRVVKKKLLNELEKLDRREKLVLGEFDSETLYNLLESEAPDGTKEKE